MQQSADVLIGLDLLVAASERSLKVAQGGKTILVASKIDAHGRHGRRSFS